MATAVVSRPRTSMTAGFPCSWSGREAYELLCPSAPSATWLVSGERGEGRGKR